MRRIWRCSSQFNYSARLYSLSEVAEAKSCAERIPGIVPSVVRNASMGLDVLAKYEISDTALRGATRFIGRIIEANAEV